MKRIEDMTDEELEALAEQHLATLRAQESGKSVAPAGATIEPGISGMAENVQAAGLGLGNALTMGAYPALNAMTDVGLGALAKGADNLTDLAGFPDLMNMPEPPGLMEAFGDRRRQMQGVEEANPYAFMGGETAGFMASPVNRAVGTAISTLPKAGQRIAATGGASAAEDALYNMAMGKDSENLADSALSAFLAGSGLQGLGEGFQALTRNISQKPEAGVSRALDSVHSLFGQAGRVDPDDLAAEAARLGPDAVAADLDPRILSGVYEDLNVAPEATAKLTDLMQRRSADIPEQIADTMRGVFPDIITPTSLTDGIKTYRQSLYPQYDAILAQLDQAPAIDGNQLATELDELVTTSLSGRKRIGAPADGSRAVRAVLERAAEDKIGRDGMHAINQLNKDLKKLDPDATPISPLDEVEFSMSELHDLRISIDNHISGVARGESYSDIRRSALIQARNELSERLGQLNPDYAALNRRYAGTATGKDAYNFGNKLLTASTSNADLDDIISDFAPGDMPFMIEGLKHALSSKLVDGVDTIGDARRVLKNGKLQANLARAIGPDATNAFIGDIDSMLTKLTTSKDAQTKLDANIREALKQRIKRKVGNLADLGTIAGIVANVAAGHKVKGPGLSSGAMFGSARRTLAHALRGDPAQVQALSEIAAMPAAEFAELMRNLPGANNMTRRGHVGGALAANELSSDLMGGPLVTTEQLGQGMESGAEGLQWLYDLMSQ